MTTTNVVSSFAQPTTVESSDVYVFCDRGIWSRAGGTNARVNPLAKEPSGEPTYPFLTVDMTIINHTATFQPFGTDGPAVHKLQLTRTFQLSNQDGTWNDKERNLYNAFARWYVFFGHNIKSTNIRHGGNWPADEAASTIQKALDACLAVGFTASPIQEAYTPKGTPRPQREGRGRNTRQPFDASRATSPRKGSVDLEALATTDVPFGADNA